MALPLPAQDAELVTLARRGSDDAFGALYERYFDGVHDFLTRLLRDRQEAADVAQDTFIKAFERLGHLEKPESFKSWLFTIAHRNGLNRIERSKRAVAVGDFYVSDREMSDLGVIDPDRSGDPERSAEARAAARLIWEAAAGLDPRTYSVMDLHVRQGLNSAEIAEVLGVSKGNAYTMVSRMKKSFSATLATYLLVRNGSADCEELAAIVARETGTGLTPALRKEADRHARTCEICQENRKVLFLPIKMFAALAAAPIPAGLKAAIWGPVKAAALAGTSAAAAQSGAGTATAAAPASQPAATTAATPAGAGSNVAIWLKAHIGPLGLAAVLVAVLLVGGTALLRNNDGANTDVLSAGVTAATQGPTIAPAPSPEPTDAPTTSQATPDSTAAPESTTLPPPVASTITTTSTQAPPTTVVPPTLVVRSDTASLIEDSSATIAVLANDTGYAAGAAPQIVTAPGHGTARTSGSSIFYVPARNYAGSDRMAYSVRGADGSTRSAQVTLTISAVNDAPVVPGPGALSMSEDGVVSFDPLAGAVDVDGDALTVTSFDAISEQGGTVSQGSLVYAPAKNWSGSDKFSYTVSDGTVDVVVTVAVVVAAVNDPPIVSGTSFTVPEDLGVGQVIGVVTATDPDGDDVHFEASSESVFAIQADGTLVLTSRLDFETQRSHSLNADAIDEHGASTSFVVTVEVTDIDESPTIADATFAVPTGAKAGTKVGIMQASDPEGLSVTFGLQGGGGLIAIDTGSGELTLVKDADPATFPITATVRASDPAGNTGTATVTVTLDDVDGPAIDEFGVDVDAFYEPPIGGGVCPSRPRFATYTADITDPSGVRGADLMWRIQVAGREISGVAKMALVDGRYEIRWSPAGPILTDRKPSTLFAKVRARDNLSNFSESREITTTLLPCVDE